MNATLALRAVKGVAQAHLRRMCLADSGPMLVKLGSTPVEFGPDMTNSGPDAMEVVGRIWPDFGRLRDDVCQIPPALGKSDPIWQEFGDFRPALKESEWRSFRNANWATQLLCCLHTALIAAYTCERHLHSADLSAHSNIRAVRVREERVTRIHLDS